MRRNWIAWAALAVATFSLASSWYVTRDVPASPQIPREGLAEAKRLSAAFEGVAEYVAPSVVQIAVERENQMVRRFRGPGPGDGEGPEELTPEEFFERFRRFFPEEFQDEPPFRFEPQQFSVQGTGSGFLYDDQGHVLTNSHVVQGADDSDITVVLSNGNRVGAKVVGTDPQTDVAVLKLNQVPTDLEPIQIGDSERLRVGQWVLAIGAPFGLSQSVTAGIISATNRYRTGILDPERGYEDFIQTDAAINPGNSGGPLVDIEGRVIGINSAIATRTGRYTGVGFAIPIKLATFVADSLIEQGTVRRALLGVQIGPLQPGVARQFGVEPGQGIIVADVIPGGPAEEAGLEAGDILVEFNGEPVENVNEFRLDVSTSKIGVPHELTYIREGRRRTTRVKLAEADSVEIPERQLSRSRSGSPSAEDTLDLPRFGLSLQEVTPEVAEELEIEEGRGLVVRGVEADSPAEEQGIRPGDLITRIVQDKKPVAVNSKAEFQELVGDADEIAVYVESGAGGGFIALEATDSE